MSNKRLAYEEKMDAQLKEWSAEIALLSAKADKAKAEEKKRILHIHRDSGGQARFSPHQAARDQGFQRRRLGGSQGECRKDLE